MADHNSLPDGLTISGTVTPEYAEILSPAALAFVARLVRHFGPTRETLLARRTQRQAEFAAGALPDFLPETRTIREGDWQIAPIPADLQDRRTEITGPVDRKMIINALNSGAKVYMADLEDANSPTWANNIEGQINLRDAIRRVIHFTSPEGKAYALNPHVATLMVRPRGWHLLENHVHIDGKPVPASLFDFGLYFFHNARALLDNGSGPYFYLPKLESHLEARLWNDVFVMAQTELGIPQGSIKATVLIETILATFELNEILYELRAHSAGLNCGRWDYIFSYIKKFHHRPDFILPDRAQVTMTTPMMRAYSLLVIQTCHRHGAQAMGGMAAQIPIKNNPQANAEALAKVLADKEREAGDGHDGTWVAHPGLVPIALQAFDRLMPTPNQIGRLREDVHVSAPELLKAPDGTVTEAGLRTNISVGIQYIEAWLGGLGCVPINNLMEDAATAEICRSQVWQWIKHGAALTDGRTVSAELTDHLITEELDKIKQAFGEAHYEAGHFSRASELFRQMSTSPEFVEFLTIPAYAYLQ